MYVLFLCTLARVHVLKSILYLYLLIRFIVARIYMYTYVLYCQGCTHIYWQWSALIMTTKNSDHMHAIHSEELLAEFSNNCLSDQLSVSVNENVGDRNIGNIPYWCITNQLDKIFVVQQYRIAQNFDSGKV